MKEFLSAEELRHARAMLDRVSVVAEGTAAGRTGVCAMHDITEGGVLGAVWEMCKVAGLGAEIEEKSIPVDPVTLKICSRFDINPLRLISSGCMLIIARPDKKEQLESVIDEITCIGKIMDTEYGIRMDGKAISPPESDELYKAV